jgi:hypothetical protein
VSLQSVPNGTLAIASALAHGLSPVGKVRKTTLRHSVVRTIVFHSLHGALRHKLPFLAKHSNFPNANSIPIALRARGDGASAKPPLGESQAGAVRFKS